MDKILDEMRELKWLENLNQEIIQLLNKELTDYRPQQINVVLTLLTDGTYGYLSLLVIKEMTGSLDEVQIRWNRKNVTIILKTLEKRKQEVFTTNWRARKINRRVS